VVEGLEEGYPSMLVRTDDLACLLAAADENERLRKALRLIAGDGPGRNLGYKHAMNRMLRRATDALSAEAGDTDGV
jgi:hypothetical protein